MSTHLEDKSYCILSHLPIITRQSAKRHKIILHVSTRKTENQLRIGIDFTNWFYLGNWTFLN